MVNYQNAKIYKLVNNSSDMCYYGSTCQTLESRKTDHKSNFKKWKEGKYHFTTSFLLFDEAEPNIILVENFSCENKEELQARERYWIENNECVNICYNRGENKDINKEKIKNMKIKYKKILNKKAREDKVKNICDEFNINTVSTLSEFNEKYLIKTNNKNDFIKVQLIRDIIKTPLKEFLKECEQTFNKDFSKRQKINYKDYRNIIIGYRFKAL